MTPERTAETLERDWPLWKARFARSPFRSRFRLGDVESRQLLQVGWEGARHQAETLIRRRLAPAFPEHDGRQTPMRGHFVFVAQHATACCCRGCLAKWHGIPAGRPLSEAEIGYVTALLLCWLRDKAADLPVPEREPGTLPGF